MQSGFLLINKPKDWTSHDVVAYLRGVTGVKKIGHAGTLDPFATGLLIVGIGREATKRLDEFKALPKEYVATLKLGATSDTYDSEGKIQETRNKIQTNYKLQITKYKRLWIEVFFGRRRRRRYLNIQFLKKPTKRQRQGRPTIQSWLRI